MATPANAPDFSKLARRPSERLGIVDYVFKTASLQETDYLEWKTGYDLSTRPGAGKTAKHLIGFANREPAAARRVAEGHAYLLLGIEPGNLPGTQRWDSADIEAWLSRFVQRDLVYDIDYVEFQGSNVVFLTVGPPKQGDPIFAMQKATGDNTFQIAEGAIFIRRGGKTETPTAADIAMLSARARTAGTAGLNLALRADASRLVPIAPSKFDDDFRESYLRDRRKKFLADLPSDTGPFPYFRRSILETRRPDTFTQEVDEWVASARSRWTALAITKHLANNHSPLGLKLVNPTDENFEAVSVNLDVPLPRMCVWRNANDARDGLKPPEEPAAWGNELALAPAVRAVAATAGAQRPEIQPVDEHTTRIRLPPVHLYPRAEADLGKIELVVLPAVAGRTLDLAWQASAKNTRGVVNGTLPIELPGGAADVT